MNCRHCRSLLTHTFLDLGFAPPSNAYLDAEGLVKPELYYPLKLKVCDRCWLVQTEDYAAADDLFLPDYAYFSSTSKGWLQHAARYAERIIPELALGPRNMVIEIASNDGYLLRNFVGAQIPCLGIEPTSSTAAAAESLGIPVLREFFDQALAEKLALQGQKADLIIGNNVFAHVPDINDFTRGLKTLLNSGGTITLEFPHLMRMIESTQFDTAYHEHFSYLSLHTVGRIFAAAGLCVHDVEELPTHGGSLRIFGSHLEEARLVQDSVQRVLNAENEAGLCDLSIYQGFQQAADKVKNDLLEFLLEAKRNGKMVAAYGAAAKGNTLINYAGIKRDLLPFVCDAASAKQGKYMPGSHIPIFPPTALHEAKPDFVLILPWNISREIMVQNDAVRGWGGKFVSAIPEIKVQ